MKTITDRDAINQALSIFIAAPEGAVATSRVLPGVWERENCQEWEAQGTLNGAAARVYYMFENSECASEDAGDYPFDMAHVSHIEIEE